MNWTLVCAGDGKPTLSLDFESKRAVLCQIELLMEQGYTKFHITQNT
jgi:hypothetical protein